MPDQGPVLVVDDDPAILETVAQILRVEGYPVRTATNGREALEVMEEQRVGLVVLDMHMPILDGWGLAQELKTRGLDPPVLVMTASRDARQAAADIQADGFLGKPFELDALLEKVEELRAA